MPLLIIISRVLCGLFGAYFAVTCVGGLLRRRRTTPGQRPATRIAAVLPARNEAQVIGTMIARVLNTVTSTSAGRLFDAVSAVLGIRRISSFEGEAATQLQFAAERCPDDLRPGQVLRPEDCLREEAGT